MNQRLFVVIAILLLVVGISGLLLFSGEEKQAEQEKIQDAVIYTATRSIKKGEALTSDSWTISNKTLQSDETAEKIPEDLASYVAAEDIAQGVVIALKAITLPEPVDTDIQKNHFLYKVPLSSEQNGEVDELKKGDLVDIYLRYYVVNDNNVQEKKIVDKNGSPVIQSTMRIIKIINGKRFHKLSVSSASDSINDALSGKVAARQQQVSIEITSEDKIKLESLSHLGDLLVYPANTVLTDVSKRIQIPEMVMEIRGRRAG